MVTNNNQLEKFSLLQNKEQEVYLEILKQVDLFQGLTETELLELIESFSIHSVKEQEVLFNQGDTADAMYVLLSGHLLAILNDENHTKRLMGKIKVGEVVGEMGFLTQSPRFLTIVAATDSKLLKLSDENFNNFTKLVPAAMRRILLNTITRNQTSIHKLENQSNNRRDFFIFGLATNPEIDLTNFADSLHKYGDKASIHFIDTEFFSNLYSTKGLAAILDYLDELSNKYNTVIYIGNHENSKLNEALLPQADILMVIGVGGSAPNYTPYLSSMLENKHLVNFLSLNVKKHLVLLWNENDTISNTALWLKQGYYSAHYHVKPNISYYQRMFRFLVGNPIGLVLGGGASRGWVHLGTLKAMEEKRIPIDFIAASSTGTGVASSYLISKNYQDMLRLVKKMVSNTEKSTSWRSITLPLVSLYDCSAITHSLEQVFGQKLIEDLEIPYYTVISNLSTGEEILENKGLMWQAIRSSASLPGLFPPFVKNGQLLMDGGLMNNLPTDHMRAIFGPKAIIIASDLGVVKEDKTEYSFTPSLTFREATVSLFTKEHHFPSLFGTFLKSVLLGSQDRYFKNLALANYCIQPDLSEFSFLDFRPETRDTLIKLGYDTAMAVLPDKI